MTDDTQGLPTAAALTDEQIRAIVLWAERKGTDRARMQGDRFREDDYFSGVMSVFFACGVRHRIPADWFFGIMSGRSVIRPDAPPSLDRDERAELAERYAEAYAYTVRTEALNSPAPYSVYRSTIEGLAEALAKTWSDAKLKSAVAEAERRQVTS